MKLYRSFIITILSFVVMACEDVIKVNLDTAPPRLVIDASIDWIKNTTGREQKITLSTTTGYYSDEFPSVSGATITVTNTSNTLFNFIEVPGTGEYNCTNFDPVIGETYTLTITLNGETYTATETLMPTSIIEDAIDQQNSGDLSGDEVEITYYYQDDGTRENYYLNSIITSHVAFPQYSVEGDEYSKGNLTPVFYSHDDLKAGDIVNIRLSGISKRYYDYMKKLLLASGNDDGPFASTPAAVRGNIVNETNSGNFAYGYFRLSEVDVKDYTIQ
jgi:uncharacterized lipoprotein YehR (DUF1307 family)